MTVRTVGIDLAIRGQHVATIMDGNGEVIGGPMRFRLHHKELE